MVWSGVVFATSYLLMQLGDDLCDALLSSRGGFGARASTAPWGWTPGCWIRRRCWTRGVLRLVLFSLTWWWR